MFRLFCRKQWTWAVTVTVKLNGLTLSILYRNRCFCVLFRSFHYLELLIVLYRKLYFIEPIGLCCGISTDRTTCGCCMWLSDKFFHSDITDLSFMLKQIKRFQLVTPIVVHQIHLFWDCKYEYECSIITEFSGMIAILSYDATHFGYQVWLWFCLRFWHFNKLLFHHFNVKMLSTSAHQQKIRANW